MPPLFEDDGAALAFSGDIEKIVFELGDDQESDEVLGYID